MTRIPKATLALALLAVAYKSLFARKVLTWGTQGAEATEALPGDELIANPDGVSTRAIAIDAPASAVWPWLAQLGPAPRGGAYTYDWIENLFGLNMHSADHVLEEFQNPRLGDSISFGANTMEIAVLEDQRTIVWREASGNWVWAFIIVEADGATRLISRNSFRLPTLAARIAMAPMMPGSLIMESKMLIGIKQRAERLAREPVSTATA